MRKHLILFGMALAMSLLSAMVSAQTNTRISATWSVQEYDVNVSIPQDGGSRAVSITAELLLRNVSQAPANTLTLRITQDAEIKSVKINSAVIEFTKNEERTSSVSRLQRIISRIPSVSPDAEVGVTVEYVLNMKDNSALSSLLPGSSHFLPLGFWYPTPNSWFFTQGPDSARVRLKVSAPAGVSVIAGGKESGGVFTQPLNGQPFFLTGVWDVVEHNGVSVYLPKGKGAEGKKRATELATLTADAIKFLEPTLGKAPELVLKLVSSRRGAGFGNGGCIVIDEAVFRRPKIDSLAAIGITEAIVRFWLGNAVKVKGDGYGAISEGLVRFLALQFIEQKHGKDVADIERARFRTSYSTVSRRDLPVSMVTPADDFYYPVVANKGSMAWRILAKRIGNSGFADIMQKATADGNLDLGELRAGMSSQKELVDYLFDGVTDMNLRVGLPVASNGEFKIALRNSGLADATVDVVATTAGGEKIKTPVTIRAASFHDISIKTQEKIIKVEIDPDKLYPQIDYFDDVAPQEISDNDLVLALKRPFDKHKFADAEVVAKQMLREHPRFDEIRVLLARSLLGQNKVAEAAREFQTVLDEKMPTARSLAWASVGLGEIAARAGQNDLARIHATAAIAIDAEYGASLAARNLRGKLGAGPPIDAGIRTFFAEFDKAAESNRKADLENLALPGEVARFTSGVSGSTEQWRTLIRYVDRLDENTALVEADMSVKLLTRNVETGMAVYRLARIGDAWRLMAVEMFEVR